MDVLDNEVQRYAWGDRRAIWDLLGVEPPGEPGAELWMGAHPVAPSRLRAHGSTLAASIEADPGAALGPGVSARFEGRLPFLFKVLAAGQALSLQVHPDAERARRGHAREEAAGLAVGDPRRTYRDPNHKPELICAVTPFSACCGFRTLDRTRALVDLLDDPGLAPLRQRLAVEGDPAQVLSEVVGWLLGLPPTEAAQLVEATSRAAARAGEGPFGAERAWARRLAAQYPGDPGVVVALLLNLVELQPGQALFLGAGNLHCYLEGVAVEVMANSDNVIRGGLTTKHVDVAELLAVVDARPFEPDVQRPDGPVHTYRSPVPEFALTRIELDPDGVTRPVGPRLVLVLEGRATVAAGGDRLELSTGDSAWVAAGDGPVVLAGRGLAYDVTVGAAAQPAVPQPRQ